jgi:hypothetical protein
MCGLITVGFLLAWNGCLVWDHWDRHGYDSDQTRYDRNDRSGFRDDRPDRNYTR